MELFNCVLPVVYLFKDGVVVFQQFKLLVLRSLELRKLLLVQSLFLFKDSIFAFKPQVLYLGERRHSGIVREQFLEHVYVNVSQRIIYPLYSLLTGFVLNKIGIFLFNLRQPCP